MLDPLNEPFFRLDIAGLSHPLIVLSFLGREAVSELFAFELDVLDDDVQLDCAGLMYRAAYLSFGDKGGIHGQVQGVTQRNPEISARYRLRLGPRLGCLEQRRSSRVFQQLSTPDIICQVLKEHGITTYHYRLQFEGNYPIVESCMQYRESDLAFLQRICAQEGIHYHFRHHRDRHLMVFSDGRSGFCSGGRAPYPAAGQAPELKTFVVTGQVLGDSRLCHETRVAEGESDLPWFAAGTHMRLADHPCEEWNNRWLLTQVQHRGDAGGYRNHFHARPWRVGFRSARRYPKPLLPGLYRGRVASVSGAESVGGNGAGSIAIQFDWLNQGVDSQDRLIWSPIADSLLAASGEPLAGLKPGMSVLVAFLRHDPDQLQVVARLSSPSVPSPVSANSMAQATTSGATDISQIIVQPPESPITPDTHGYGPLLALLQGCHPLVLLCDQPSEGSFNHCIARHCLCRWAALRGRRGER